MLDGKVAVVTGGSNGIGRAIATAFAEQGAAVTIADRRREPREGEAPTDEMLTDRGYDARFVEIDVSDPESVRELFETTLNEYGRVDVLVNNAAVFDDGSALELDLAHWQGMVDVNLTGVFLCCKYALPHLVESDGNIINISSVAGIQASSNSAAYCATKAGVTNLTRQMALDYGEAGVRVNSIHPGLIEASSTRGILDTEKGATIVEGVPKGRLGKPDEIAGAAVFLASDLASYVNGHALVVDGGLTTKYY